MELRSILITKLSSLGDIIHTFPAAELLRSAVGPEVEIDWMAGSRFVPVLDFCPWIDGVIAFPREELGSFLTFPGAVIRLRKSLRQKKYDLAVDFQGLLKSSFFTRLSGVREIAGFANPKERGAGCFYTKKIDVDSTHAVCRNLELVSRLFGGGEDFVPSRIPVIERHSEKADLVLAESGIDGAVPRIAVCAGSRWKSKTWPPEFFAGVLKGVSRRFPEARFLMLGTESDAEQSRRVVEIAAIENIVELAGRTELGPLVELIRSCELMICNDSGPMHIAAALGKPVFAFFGPTDPGRTGPYGDGHGIYVSGVDCSPCFKRNCANKNYMCHDSVDGEKVVSEIVNYLEEGDVR